MFDAEGRLPEPKGPRPTKSFRARHFPRKRRQHLDDDALAYGYIHPDHFTKTKQPRILSSRPGCKMYSQQAYWQQRPPPPFYQNDFASQSYVSERPLRSRPSRLPPVWASSSTLDLPPQYTGPHREGWHSTPSLVSTPPPQKPPRPPQNRVRFNDRPSVQNVAQGPAFADNLRHRLGALWTDRDPPENREHVDSERLWVEALDRELLNVEQEPQNGESESARSRPDGQRNRNGLINYSKTWMFANSRLPPHQPPFKAFFETWRLICRAVRSSAQVYGRPKGDQREHFIAADQRHRTKAMVLKSTPLDDQNLIVFSIRGSQVNYFDWDVNLHPAPAAPEGFLDDGSNACHSGFLKVAKAMVAPVAARLRQLLEQDPSRCSSSLLITGHSAGGAVASLLYMHMLATSVESELTILAGCFKRVHCITFGVPPISFLPLQKPSHLRANKSLFLSFVNEGDLVVRADKAYVLSLAKILAGSKGIGSLSANTLAKKASHAVLKSAKGEKGAGRAPYWPVPEAPLSNAGRLVLLREKPGSEKSSAIEAVVTDDQKMRDVVFGDPAMHAMALYQQRVEALAFAAMLGEDAG